uniref:Uncharacterized protein n=1 Tax=Leersia perrieri TaxID=77586 RepID=A0A0D9XJY3_9ORYZ
MRSWKRRSGEEKVCTHLGVELGRLLVLAVGKVECEREKEKKSAGWSGDAAKCQLREDPEEGSQADYTLCVNGRRHRG